MAKIKRLKVKYCFDELGFPVVVSNLTFDEFDMLDLLLSGDLHTQSSLLKFEQVTMRERKVWWSDATKVYFESGELEITSACGFEATVRISHSVLQQVLDDWNKFLINKIAFEAEY